ncbi:sugar-transfer associated ATP-grasp domain-containing protein [Rhizorhabdus sp. FW153]|uniref:sugar-transfer associated ATP-grasp domain-containing protein n=1 Tax=Rhizorhabdus sp. FW153 TaxID=3400216 RepID=UPI003CF514D4
MARRFWHNLPWDGQGLARASDPTLYHLRSWSARAWRRERAPSLHGAVGFASKFLWPLAALGAALRFSRRIEGVAPVRLYRDCVATGATPLEAHVWRTLHASPHPLPARAAALLLPRLGSPEAHHLLADKLATAAKLAEAALTFPTLFGVLEQGKPIDFSSAALPDRPLFLKPRHGHGGRGAFALDGHAGEWRIDGQAVPMPTLLDRLQRSVRFDDLLVQERLTASPDLVDLAVADPAPVLRIVTGRWPGAEPFVHSAMLTLGVPGQNPAHFLDGALYVPVDVSTGRMMRGIRLSRPNDRLDRLPWNGAALKGRVLPDFGIALAAALRAMDALPPLPLVHWDFIPTASGPVLLEGNSSGNWIIATLPQLEGPVACDLADILAQWVPDPTRP